MCTIRERVSKRTRPHDIDMQKKISFYVRESAGSGIVHKKKPCEPTRTLIYTSMIRYGPIPNGRNQAVVRDTCVIGNPTCCVIMCKAYLMQ